MLIAPVFMLAALFLILGGKRGEARRQDPFFDGSRSDPIENSQVKKNDVSCVFLLHFSLVTCTTPI